MVLLYFSMIVSTMLDNEPLVATLPVCSPTDPPRRKADTAKWKQQHKDKASTLPLNLISATNQQKVSNIHMQSAIEQYVFSD